MDREAKLSRFIRSQAVAGLGMFGLVALRIAMAVAGTIPINWLAVAHIAGGTVLGVLMLRTAHLARLDRDDPAGIEARFEAEAFGMSWIVVGGAFLVVIALIAWGMLF